MNCQASRESLEGQLAASRYGQDTAIFNCTFVAGAMPPRCVACNRLIAEHTSAGAAPPPMVGPGAECEPQPRPANGVIYGVGPQMYGIAPAGGAAPPYGMPPSSAAAPYGQPTAQPHPMMQQAQVTGGPVVLPQGMVAGPQVDKMVTGGAGGYIFAIVGGFMIVLGTILLISFASSGMFEFTYAPIAGPLILYTIAIIFSFIPTKITAEFDKVRRELRYTSGRLLYPCFGQTALTIPFSNITGCTLNMSNVRVNRVPIMHVQLLCAGISQGYITVGSGNMFIASQLCAQWVGYLNSIGIQVASAAPAVPAAMAVGLMAPMVVY